jgi:hypothetical protein
MKNYLFRVPETTEIGNYHDGISDIILSNKSIDWDDFLKISIVRNPYDWYISFWKYSTSLSEHWMNTHALQIEFSENFLKSKKFEDYTFLEFLSFIVYLKSKTEFKTSQMDFLTHDGSLKIDLLIKLENINNSLPKIEKKLQFSIGDFPHLNNTIHQSYSFYYTDECYSIVNSLCERDFFLFDYKMENII